MHEEDLYHICDPKLFNISDFDILLNEILNQSRNILNAEAGSIYMNEGDFLSFNIFQNDSISYENVYRQFHALKDLKLPLAEQEKYLAVKSFVSRKVITIDDIYESEEYDFLGAKEFDKNFNYRTKSIITAPIIHPFEQNAIGVIQLLNKSVNGNLVKFTSKDQEILTMVCSFIGLTITKAQNDIEKLKKLNLELEKSNEELKEKVCEEVKISQKKSSIIYHQSKLVSMGEMIGNIAHQWRQPLSAISTIASGLNFNIEIGNYNKEETITSLNRIVNTTQHLSQTIDDFRNFYKADKEKCNFAFSKSIESSLGIIQASLSDSFINIICDLDESIHIYAYENELKQSILNILHNARDAIEENSIEEDCRVIFVELKKEENVAVLKIKDNAGGIDKSIISKIFDQNFTTKEDKGGTGIGLYMTKQIIEEHLKGLIEVNNENIMYKNKYYKCSVFTIRILCNQAK